MQCTLCHNTIEIGDFLRHTRTVNPDKSTNPADCERVRHTAIQCQHPLSVIRERMSAVLQDVLNDETPGYIDVVVTRVVAECSHIMIEHADEIASEYKAIIRRINQFIRRINQ